MEGVSTCVYTCMGSIAFEFFLAFSFYCIRFSPLVLEFFPSHFLYIPVALALWFLRISIYMYMTLFGLIQRVRYYDRRAGDILRRLE